MDVMILLPNGQRHRERRVLTHSKSAAQRWGQDRERHLLQHGLPKPKKEVPTLKQFAPRFVDGHARANRQKPSGIAAQEVLLRVHLVPFLGHKLLDGILEREEFHRSEYRSFLLAQRALALACGEHETARSLTASLVDLDKVLED